MSLAFLSSSSPSSLEQEPICIELIVSRVVVGSAEHSGVGPCVVQFP